MVISILSLIIAILSPLITILISEIISSHRSIKNLIKQTILFLETLPNSKVNDNNRKETLYLLEKFKIDINSIYLNRKLKLTYNKIYNSIVAAINLVPECYLSENIFISEEIDLLNELKKLIKGDL